MATTEELRLIWDHVGIRHGWDFSRLKVRRDPTPWVYEDIIRSLARTSEAVLDVGTGGGERLIALADAYDSAIGIDIDPEMVSAAMSNRPESLAGRVEFRLGDAHSTGVDDSSIDVVLVRHSIVDVPELLRVLKPNGRFVTQQVGERNLESVVGPFGGQVFSNDDQSPHEIRDSLLRCGMSLLRFEEYDVPYRFLDLESLIFQIKAIGHYLPVEMSFDSIADVLVEVVESIETTDGDYLSNEHRWLITAESQ